MYDEAVAVLELLLKLGGVVGRAQPVLGGADIALFGMLAASSVRTLNSGSSAGALVEIVLNLVISSDAVRERTRDDLAIAAHDGVCSPALGSAVVG